MKNIYKLLPILFIAVLTACGGNGGDDPNPELTFQEKMQGTWSISSVTRDGSDVSSEFSGFTLTISSTSYSVTNGGTAWVETSGSIVNFDGQSPASSVQASFGNLSVTMEFSNDNKTLTLTFTQTDTILGGGRVESLAGNYVFVLAKA